jgi:hypothetical protein
MVPKTAQIDENPLAAVKLAGRGADGENVPSPASTVDPRPARRTLR